MTTAVAEAPPGVKPKDLRAFTRTISTAILALVNNRGVKYRIFKDGNHLFLYPPDRAARPCKISAHRSDEANIRYLNDFVDKYLGPVPTADRPAKPDELAPLLTLNTKPPEQRGAPDAETDAGEWRVHHRATGEPTTFETNGKVWRCTAPGCSWTTTKKLALGPHAGNHKSVELNKDSRRAKPPAKPWAGRHPSEKTPLDAERVRELRERSGKRWGDLGQEIGITPEGIRQWLKRGECASVWVEPFAKALGVTPDVLIGVDPLPGDPLFEQPEPEPATAPEPEPLAEPEPATAPVPTDVATGVARDYLTEILRVARTALGETDLSAELAQARAKLAEKDAELKRVQTQLDEARARLELLREAWEAVGK